MDHLAESLDRAADDLRGVERAAAALTVPPGAFADAAAGLPGRLGQSLREHWAAAVAARAQEAARASARLTAMAASIRAARDDYAATDDSVRRRLAREL
ncbi:hypothetical protein Ade02nite_64800 [Paractinoplanes deccanensis]|uniref:Excreted virulence factor EspC (Type VII ESX diderm) n=1 Tax=Paractinoplanes deccanensis TaxID=113561 RepID=A0ABQ3YCV8_9ACTN|nr:hypothetical protein [Actinoplanes deccanensis]GID77839.1 hypothetical protein Ade02nite_64800 [Actinoplanes deccanensis]